MSTLDVDDLVARCAWERRDPQFTDLGAFVDYDVVVPMMQFRPGGPGEAARDEDPEWPQVIARWRELPPHASILRPTFAEAGGYIWLRYAAIRWDRGTYCDTDEGGTTLFATWALQLADAFETVAGATDVKDWGLLYHPYVALDIRLHVRLAFLPPTKIVRLDEHAWVAHIGSVLPQLGSVTKGSEISKLVDRCTTRSSLHGFKTLRDVKNACRKLGAKAELGDLSAHAWSLTEEALGWMAVRDPMRALDKFIEAKRIGSSPLVSWGIRACAQHVPAAATPPPEPTEWTRIPLVFPDPRINSVSWQHTKAKMDSLEAERDFQGVLALFEFLYALPSEAAELHTRRARCHLELRESGLAIDYARRALHTDPARVDAHVLLVRALIEHRKHADALVEADALLRSASYDATAHYLRGKALLGLGRLEEARDAFDLAIALKPTMLEAMLLRREADRTLVRLGKAIGKQHVSIAIPESLEHLRDVLTSGRSKPAIEALSLLPDDPDAQLLLARFLGFDGKHDEAIVIYDRLASTSHRHAALVGKAGALLEEGHAESALAIFDALIADTPNDREATEGRARALDRLGRTSEAAAEFRRFVSLATAGADLRVRAAQLWLEHH